MNLENIAKALIDTSDYLSLSTATGNKPWATPIYYAVDEKYTFYFVSRKDTIHSKNICKNKNVSFCIFNSQDKSFTAQGVQAQGIASEVGLNEVLHGLTVIFKKKHPKNKIDLLQLKQEIKTVTGSINNRVYKIVPTHIFILDPNNPDMDVRVEVKLN